MLWIAFNFVSSSSGFLTIDIDIDISEMQKYSNILKIIIMQLKVEQQTKFSEN